MFKSKAPAIYLPPPPRPDPALADREAQNRQSGLENQETASKARKKQIQAGYGRRSLLSSSGGGFLSNTTNNTNLS